MHLIKRERKVRSIITLLALTIKDTNNLYILKYYRIEYFNSEMLIFMTTNEPDLDWNERILDTDFQWIPDFDQLIKEIDNSKFLDHITSYRFNSPPKYIYYDIVLINDLLKPILLEHLQENISNFTASDLTDYESLQINHWLQYLKM